MPDEFLPGEAPQKRELPFFWLVDRSGSMIGDKIAQVNYAVREVLPELTKASANQPSQIMMRVLMFGSGSEWVTPEAVSLEKFEWEDVEARRDQLTDMGDAMQTLAEALDESRMPTRGLPPVIVLLTDGQPTDDFESGLAKAREMRWFKASVRAAIAIGSGAQESTLEKFTENPEMVLRASNPETLVRFIKWASISLSSQVSAPALRRDDESGSVAEEAAAPPEQASSEVVWL